MTCDDHKTELETTEEGTLFECSECIDCKGSNLQVWTEECDSIMYARCLDCGCRWVVERN